MANSALKLQLLTDQSLPFWNTANTFSVNMSAPTGLAGNVSFILPGTQPTATGQILYTTAAGISSWTTATYPLTTTANQLLYSTGANTVAGLATANNSVLVTSAGGVPSMSATLPAAVLGNITSVGALDSGSLVAGFTPVTVPIGGTGNTTFTAYSVICAGTTATGTFQNVVGLGTNGYVLTSTGPGSLPTWQSTGAVTGVASVTGTALQIDATPTTGNVVVSIDAGYLGQTSITTLGTITTGVWTGTNVALAHGGTSASLVASNGGIVYSTAGAMAILAGTATATQMLQSGSSTTPAWSTTTWPATTAASTLLYSNGANTIAALATANNGVLITSGIGVPSISSTLPAAVQGNIVATGALAAGSLAAGFTPVTVPLGGTGNTTFTAYSVICAGTTATGTFQNVTGLGTNGYVLTSNGAGSLPTWQSTGAVTGVASVSGTALQIDATPTTGNVVISIDAGYVGQTSITTLGTIGTGTWAGTNIALNHGGTNAALTASNGGIFYSTATAGAILAGTATANQVLLSGSSTTPAWSTATYPATTTINQLLYSSAANTITGLATSASAVLTTVASVPTWAAELSLALGGTNANLTASNGGIFYSTATAGAILAGTATAGQLLTSGASTTPAWTTSTYPATNAINTLLYASSANVMAALATANSGTLATSSTGVPSIVALGATQTLVGVSGGTPAAGTIPGQNMIINGDMQIWQRGAGGSAAIAVTASTTAYTADRWQLATGANQAFTVTQSAGATSGSYLAKVQRNNAQTGTTVVPFATSLTRDMCIGAAGNIITLSFKAKSGANYSSAASALSVTVYSGTGTTDISGLGGAFTGSATPISQTATLSSTLTNFSYSSSALGSTITQLCVQFSFTPVGTAGADDSFSITDIQLEISPVQTPFERLPFTVQRQKCQYFYWKTFPYGTAPAQNSGTNLGAIAYIVEVGGTAAGGAVNVRLPVPMRVAPTPVFYNPSNTNTNWRDISLGADSGAGAASLNSEGAFFATNVQVVGDVASVQIVIHASCDVDVT